MASNHTFRRTCERIIENLGLGRADQIETFRPLSGGVSSDIALVVVNGRQICVKCALPQLKVQETWLAPLHRNLAEYRWLAFAGSVRPDSVPKLLGRDAENNGFAMAYVNPDQAWLYKQALLDGAPDTGQARQTGASLAAIQAASTQPGFTRDDFDNAPDFHALRLEPYLEFTATRHPKHASHLQRLSSRTNAARIALVHGDVSPKNLLIAERGPLFLDAECATFGDPAFDAAFFVNHLLIKSIHMPARSVMLLNAARDFWQAYLNGVTWEPVSSIELRTAELLPALMLARVDGKSPVEYLDASGQNALRESALQLIAIGYDNLNDLFTQVSSTSL